CHRRERPAAGGARLAPHRQGAAARGRAGADAVRRRRRRAADPPPGGALQQPLARRHEPAPPPLAPGARGVAGAGRRVPLARLPAGGRLVESRGSAVRSFWWTTGGPVWTVTLPHLLPPPVSTSPSSNRTCRSPASGSPSRPILTPTEQCGGPYGP